MGILVEPVFEALLSPIFSGLKVQSAELRHTIAIAVGFFTNTFLLVVVGELTPKALAIRKTLRTALNASSCRNASPAVGRSGLST